LADHKRDKPLWDFYADTKEGDRQVQKDRQELTDRISLKIESLYLFEVRRLGKIERS